MKYRLKKSACMILAAAMTLNVPISSLAEEIPIDAEIAVEETSEPIPEEENLLIDEAQPVTEETSESVNDTTTEYSDGSIGESDTDIAVDDDGLIMDDDILSEDNEITIEDTEEQASDPVVVSDEENAQIDSDEPAVVDEIEENNTESVEEVEESNTETAEAETDDILFDADPTVSTNIKVNSTDVTIYYVSNLYSKWISVPDNLPTEYQIGAVREDGGNGEIYYDERNEGNRLLPTPLKNGIIVANSNLIGDDSTTIRVMGDGNAAVINVTIKEYSRIAAEKILDDWMAENLSSSMSQVEKAEAITKYVAENYNYTNTEGSSDYIAMALSGGGDCWASTSMIIYMCGKQGIRATRRDARYNGSNHENALIIIGNEYYIAEAGYDREKPRPYYLKKTDSMFTIQIDYDEGQIAVVKAWNGTADDEKDLVIPSEYVDSGNTYTVAKINDFAFLSKNLIKTVTIPETVTTVGEGAFGGCSSLVSINASGDYFKTVDGNLLSADGKVFVAHADGNSAPCVIPSGVTEIADGAFYYSDIEGAVLPAGITKIGKDAFFGTDNLKSIELPDTLTEIGDYAFDYSGLSEITVPASVSKIGECALYGIKNITILSKNAEIDDLAVNTKNKSKVTITGYPGSTAETYAKEKGFTFQILHSWGSWAIEKEASCTSEGSRVRTCTDCGEKQTEVIPAAGHKYSTATITKKATCTKEGIKTFTCSVCGETVTEKIPATGHTAGEVKVTKAAACDKKGVRTTYCSVCGNVIKTVDIPATGHTTGETKVTKNATCNEKGVKTTYCSVCGAAIKTEDIPATGHIPVATYEIVQEASCTTEGRVITSKCSVCGVMLDNKIIPKKEHANIKEDVITPATCTTDGVKYIYCGDCYQLIRKETIKATGHSYGAFVITKAASCTESGKREKKCYVCGNSITETIPASGHAYSEWQDSKQATVYSSGTQTRTCSRCGDTQSRKTDRLPATVKVTPAKASVVKGSKVTLTAAVQNGDSVKSWKSSNKKVATVTSKGIVTGKKKGTAKITVKTKAGASKTITITVTNKAKSVKTKKLSVSASGLKNNKITIKKGKSVSLKAKATPSNSTQKVTYSSSNKKIATVSSKGKVKAVKKGSCTISVKSGSKTVKVKVTVK